MQTEGVIDAGLRYDDRARPHRPCISTPNGTLGAYLSQHRKGPFDVGLNMEVVFLVLFVAATVRADPHVPCLHDQDCSLNGVCTAGSCVCDPGWTTLPFGVDGALSPGCGYLDLLPSPVSECGPACAFHGGVSRRCHCYCVC